MRSTDRPVLITNAAVSEEDQLSARKRRYVVLMGGRLALFLLAAVTYPVSAWLAVGLLAMSLPLPWMAVLIANDAPARRTEDDSDGFFMIVFGVVGTSGAGGDLIPG